MKKLKLEGMVNVLTLIIHVENRDKNKKLW